MTSSNPNWGRRTTMSDGRWDTRKFKRKPSKKIRTYDPAEDLCRVVPFRLAQIPGIGEWLMKQRKARATLNINVELDVVYRELAEMRKTQLLED